MKIEMKKCLQIVVEDVDWHHSEPLYAAIIRILHKRGLAGATVCEGVMGYGIHGRIHRKGLFGVTNEKPIVIFAVDTDEKIRKVLPEISKLVKEGLIFLADVEVISSEPPAV
ncbi:DUF190 domain-containing protein [Bryobacter aggregatus]|uniref:DUF190 domain-containing protein n=1 Tax=Bryobacter aggregatus TaxID=360054 RepID=UPI00056B2878|nr:DUF190 domain-containing protein [Bryobacter aggregatus]